MKKCHVHPVYSAGIRTHDLLNNSRLPLLQEKAQQHCSPYATDWSRLETIFDLSLSLSFSNLYFDVTSLNKLCAKKILCQRDIPSCNCQPKTGRSSRRRRGGGGLQSNKNFNSWSINLFNLFNETTFLKNGPTPASFCLFSFFSQYNDKYSTNLTINEIKA